MDHERFLSSKFYKWHLVHSPNNYIEQEQHIEGLRILQECVSSGEIDSLDSINSPLSRMIQKLHGLNEFEMNSNWIRSGQDWSCPCCGRSKLQISRIGNKGQILAKLILHHDHMGEALETAFHKAFEKAETCVEQSEGLRLVERMGKAFSGYDEILICEDCNNADAEAKKLVNAPRFFSFSPGQINVFIRVQANTPHFVDIEVAQEIWAKAAPAYKLRMELIETVAHAAATDSHWYESFKGISPTPMIGASHHRVGDSVIEQWFGIGSIVKALGATKSLSSPNLSRWRTRRVQKAKPLPVNFMAMLRSDPWNSKFWDSLCDSWQCPICRRTKFETIYVNEKGKLKFSPASTSDRGAWKGYSTICNHCKSTLMSLKWEVVSILGKDLQDSYSFVAPAELANIIIPIPHSTHGIDLASAEALITDLVARLSSD